MSNAPFLNVPLSRRRLFELGLAGSAGLMLGETTGPAAAAAAADSTLRMTLSTLHGEDIDPIQGHPDKTLKAPLFDWLVGANREGTDLSSDTGIAKHWELSPDGLTWTFAIRAGVPWHKGHGQVTADDVAFSINRLIGPQITTVSAVYFKQVIDKAVAVNPTTVQVHMKRRAVDLALKLSAMAQTEGCVLPKAYFEKAGEDGFRRSPIGSGPYQFVSHQVGSKAVFKALGRHWSYGTPKYKMLEIRQVAEDSTRIAMLHKGEANFIDIPRRFYASLKKEGKFTVRCKLGDETITTWFPGQLKGGALANGKVREALSKAIDRTQLIKLFGGSELAQVATHIGTCGPWVSYCLANTPDTYDPAAAKKALQASGQGPFEIELADISDYPEEKVVSEALAGWWGEIGVRTRIVPMDFGTWRTTTMGGKGAPTSAICFGNPDSVLDAPTLEAFYFSGSPIKLASSPELDGHFHKMFAAKTLTSMGEQAGKIGKIVFEQHYELPLVVTGTALAFDHSVTDTRLGGKQFVDFGYREILTGT